MSKIAKLWANKVISGDRQYSDVPAQLKNEVEEILKELGYPNLVIKTTKS